MDEYKYVYEVVVRKGEAGAFALLNLGADGYTEFVDWDDEDNEVHSIYTNFDIDRELDARPQILTYTVTDSYGN